MVLVAAAVIRSSMLAAGALDMRNDYDAAATQAAGKTWLVLPAHWLLSIFEYDNCQGCVTH